MQALSFTMEEIAFCCNTIFPCCSITQNQSSLEIQKVFFTGKQGIMTHRCRPPEWIIQIHLVWKKLSSVKVITSMRDTTPFYKPKNRARSGAGHLQMNRLLRWAMGCFSIFFLDVAWKRLKYAQPKAFFFVSLHLSELTITLIYSVPQVKSRKHVFKLYQHLCNITHCFT